MAIWILGGGWWGFDAAWGVALLYMWGPNLYICIHIHPPLS